MLLKNKTALITGASAGIGESIAEIFAENGANLILLARREERLIKLKENLKKKYGTESHIIVCDIRNYNRLQEEISRIDKELKKVSILINNAGMARGLNKIQDSSVQDWDETIDTNIKGLLYVTNLLLPYLLKKKSAHIVNIGSMAGYEVYPGGNVYCATKFALKGLSKAMQLDLQGTGVKVTNIAPLLVETEFSNVRFYGDLEKAKQAYSGYNPLKAKDIAEITLFTVTRPHNVMIQEVIVTPTDKPSALAVSKN